MDEALRAYSRAKPWDVLFPKHIFEFTAGPLRGFALSVGSPARNADPTLVVAPTFEVAELMTTGAMPTDDVASVIFDMRSGLPDMFMSGNPMQGGTMDSVQNAAAGLPPSKLALLVGGARAITAFMTVFERQGSQMPSVKSSGLGDFKHTAGIDDNVSPAVVWRYPPYIGAKSPIKQRDQEGGFGALRVAEQTAGECVSLPGLLRSHRLHGQGWWWWLSQDAPAPPPPGPLSLAAGLALLPASHVPAAMRHDLCPGGLHELIKNWSSWCLFRGVSVDSPAPLVLHNALTVYHALCCAVPHVLSGAQATVRIHLVGVEGNEVFGIGTFAEVATLLPATTALEIQLVGPGVPKERDGEVVELIREGGGATAKATLLWCQDYTSFAASDERYLRPDLVVGLNAGLNSPHQEHFADKFLPFVDAVKGMIDAKVHAVFTDYVRPSCEMPMDSWLRQDVQRAGGTLLETTLNPFRQPLLRNKNREYMDQRPDESGHPYPVVSNGHIFGFHFSDTL